MEPAASITTIGGTGYRGFVGIKGKESLYNICPKSLLLPPPPPIKLRITGVRSCRCLGSGSFGCCSEAFQVGFLEFACVLKGF